ncbi:uncharacterized protein LOC110018925 [Phalaenopsis equestris]|uniref:uncharacterized protein LOC110018925 n=1 Tax=Phalaenopsis equestris TaxID=78828 RepID=UPI0009E37583|nr:uncharacterized protein LOC110018925 [Phalaenopsis equestris]
MALSSLRPFFISRLASPDLRNSDLASRGVRFSKKDGQPMIQLKQPKFLSGLSRRDAISLLSSTLLTNFLVAETAEARSSRSENKRRALKKLEEQREKAENTKEKTEPGSNKKRKSALLPPNSFPVPTVEAKLKAVASNPSFNGEAFQI